MSNQTRFHPDPWETRPVYIGSFYNVIQGWDVYLRGKKWVEVLMVCGERLKEDDIEHVLRWAEKDGPDSFYGKVAALIRAHRYCGAKRRLDNVGHYCPTVNCQWRYGYATCTLHKPAVKKPARLPKVKVIVARRPRPPKLTLNQLIRQAAASAMAYIPVTDRAKWLRGWRKTARTVTRGTLINRLERHTRRLRMSNGRVVGTGANP